MSKNAVNANRMESYLPVISLECYSTHPLTIYSPTDKMPVQMRLITFKLFVFLKIDEFNADYSKSKSKSKSKSRIVFEANHNSNVI